MRLLFKSVRIGVRSRRFNYSHRAAMIYFLFGTCKIDRINPHEWLKDILSRIKDHPINRIAELLPHNWRFLQE